MKDVTDLSVSREYPVSVARLWRAVTQPDQIAEWFGPEAADLDPCNIDFSKTGPYDCVIVHRESGNRYHVSGQVTHVRPPNGGNGGSVGLTWAWHDDSGNRGHESHVSFLVEPAAKGARLIIDHRGLVDAESAQNHKQGWTSTLNKLEAFLAR